MFAFGEELQPVPTGQILLLTLDNLWLHFQLYMMIVWCSFPRRRSYWVRHAFHEPPRTSAWEAKSDDPQSVSVCILAWEGKNDSKWSSEIQAICNNASSKDSILWYFETFASPCWKVLLEVEVTSSRLFFFHITWSERGIVIILG